MRRNSCTSRVAPSLGSKEVDGVKKLLHGTEGLKDEGATWRRRR
jgi:hypothetical protein